MNIKNVLISEIRPYERNPRKNKEAVKYVANSIREFGWKQPIVVDKDGVIVAGHTRYLAAKELGLDYVPVVVADDLTEEQIKAYRLADNKVSEFANWDLDLLDIELGDIADVDMEKFGFSGVDKSPEALEDDYELVLPSQPKAKPGQVYLLGNHRLMCGDATSESDIVSLLGGASVKMLLTDPPYNVDYEGKAGKIANDAMGKEEYRCWLAKALSACKKVMQPGAVFHVWYGDSEAFYVRGSCMDAGFMVRQQLVWVKNQATLGRQDFQHQYESVLAGDFGICEEADGKELCAYGWLEGKHSWYKRRKEKDVLFFEKPRSSDEHPTMKPIKLFDYEMRCNTQPGDAILDVFAGSGTTIMAAEQNGRVAYCMEYDPRFVDVIVDRWEAWTGRKAVLLEEERENVRKSEPIAP